MHDRELTPDTRREQRIGFDEAIYCAGKNARQLSAVLDDCAARGASALLTRLGEPLLAELAQPHRQRLDHDLLSHTAFFGDPAPLRGDPLVAILTAGTSDVAVAREAARTLRYYGEAAIEINDVGVAGLWRLLERVDTVREVPVCIVAAGMDAALPSVVTGLVPGAVIAVPTSVGYGVASGGQAALNAALASCAPGLVVVNIDNGYGAACAALRMLRRHEPPTTGSNATPL